MTPEQIVGKTVVTRIVEKNKSKSFTTLSTIMMKTVRMIDNQMKKTPLNMHCFKIILKEI